MKIFISLLAAGAGVAVLDLFWVGWAMNGFYKARLGHLMADRVFWPAAAGFYLLYPAGIWFFAASPAASSGGAAARGAALGLVVYGVYNFTNMALLKDWAWQVTALDMAWGVFLTAAAAAAAYAAGARF
jgi:uncharacterized membrane protein